jgi:RNA polymerase sigma factor (sigma-70 family)
MDQIIRGCQQQLADCQKALYKQYFGLMMNICNRYANNREDAEEMLNNGFLKIFSNISQFEHKGSFEGWMKRIVVNSCLDYLKSKSYRNSARLVALPGEGGEHEMDGLMFRQQHFDENLREEKYSREDLMQMLQSLPEQTRTVFNLFVFEEFSHKEIAEQLNMAERTSQWHLSNARKVLGEALINKKEHHQKVAGV